VTISGTNLAAATAVHFGSTPASFSVNGSNQIVATSPAGSGTVDVTVTIPGETTATGLGDRFTYTTVCLSAGLSPANPREPAGSTVVLTASSTGCSNPEYQFFVQYPDQSWHLIQSWGAAGLSWDTIGLAPGTYTVHVWANQASHSTATYEAVGSDTVTLTGCTSASISPPLVGQQAGTTVSLTASAVGCPNPKFEFFALYPNGLWYQLSSWGGSGLSWTTTGLARGLYTIHVWANQAGASTATYETLGSATVSLSFCSTAGLGPPSPSAPASSTVALTAISSGCTSPQYAFYVQYPNLNWYLIQPFSSSAALSWNTKGLAPGNYLVHAWVSAIGSGHDSVGSDTVSLTGCTTASVAPTTQTQAAGTTVNLTGSGSSGCPDPQFEDWVEYPDATWHLGRSWGPAAWGWNTTGLKPGLYTIHAWTNQIGASTATYEAIGAGTVSLTGCTAATVAPASGSNSVGTTITFTVTPTCSGTPVYEFWLHYPDGTWHQETLFTTTNTWIWNTTGWAKGTYVMHVWVNNQGAGTTSYETIGVATVTLT
jgi:hypothetical protein